ncbi:MAG: hypothetical protein MJ252_24320 [archaeon]|nr:hypothetical protein [archaeon]
MFHSLDDYRQKEDPKEKDKKKNTESYTGGHSGLAVENPLDSKYGKNDLEGYGKAKDHLKLKVYKNGFIVDDGPFRPLDKPENKKFMDEVKKGYIPKELVDQGYKDLGIALDNANENDDYVPSPEEKKFTAFTGSGQSLGNVNTSGLKVNKGATFAVDKSKPTCKVNIRLFNGETISGEFNTTNTLRDIINFVTKASGSQKFQLLDGFPPRPLTAFDKTIEELRLAGSTLTQRIG